MRYGVSVALLRLGWGVWDVKLPGEVKSWVGWLVGCVMACLGLKFLSKQDAGARMQHWRSVSLLYISAVRGVDVMSADTYAVRRSWIGG